MYLPSTAEKVGKRGAKNQRGEEEGALSALLTNYCRIHENSILFLMDVYYYVYTYIQFQHLYHIVKI